MQPCYRRGSVLCLRLLVAFVSPPKAEEPIKMLFWQLNWVGARNYVLDGGPNPPGEGQLSVLSGSLDSCSFGILARYLIVRTFDDDVRSGGWVTEGKSLCQVVKTLCMMCALWYNSSWRMCRLSCSEEQECMNVWTAYLNFENMYGTQSQLDEVLRQAQLRVDPVVIQRRLCDIYARSGKFDVSEC